MGPNTWLWPFLKEVHLVGGFILIRKFGDPTLAMCQPGTVMFALLAIDAAFHGKITCVLSTVRESACTLEEHIEALNEL